MVSVQCLPFMANESFDVLCFKNRSIDGIRERKKKKKTHADRIYIISNTIVDTTQTLMLLKCNREYNNYNYTLSIYKQSGVSQ